MSRIVYPLDENQMKMFRLMGPVVKACQGLIDAQAGMLNYLFENIQPGGLPEDVRTVGKAHRDKITEATKAFDEIQAQLNQIPK